MAKPKKIKFRVLLVVFIIFFIGVILAVPNYRKCDWINHGKSGFKGCSIAIQTLTEAIELAELHDLTELTDENITILKGNNYLSENWPFKSGSSRSSIVDRDKCKYHISGNLSKDGFIYCGYHGSINYIEEDGNGGYNHMYYGSQGENIKKVGNKTIYSNVPDNVKYDISKAKIPPSKEYYKDEWNKKIKNFLDNYGLGIIFIVLGLVFLFIFA